MSSSPIHPAALQGLNPQQQALLGALGQVLEPLADLCIGQGVAIQAIEEALRHAMVRAARKASAGANPERLTSRISTMTGLTRREVARIEQASEPARPASRSLVTEIFTRWAFEPEYRDAANQPRALPKMGPAPSFEALAKRVTSDVHPRSLVAEMERLGLLGRDGDELRLLKDSLVPQGDWAHMVGFLGDNVGDHLRAATANVLGDGPPHFEQSVLADELSLESMAQVKRLITQQWQQVMSDIVPQLEALMAQDAAAGRARDQAVRIGMYSWMREMSTEEQARSATPTLDGISK
jgi:hypothetical protein